MEEQKRIRKRMPGWSKILIAVILTFVVTVGGAAWLLGRGGMALIQGYLLARFAFVETDVNLDNVVDKGLVGLVSGLGDRWSYYLDPESFQATLDSRANQYVGIGVTVSYEREEGLLIAGVTQDGPGEEVGIVVGDIITQVDGVSLAGETRYEATNYIMGEEGTPVELTILGADGATRTVVCTRKKLQSVSVTSTMLEDQVGYVRIDNFYAGCADTFRQEVEGLMEQGAVGLVLDVRSNPGGFIDELVPMLDYLLPEGPIFVERPRWGMKMVRQSDASCVELPMVVLVNGDSYSAAELFAAQLRESAQVPIVGERTSGKGYAQITFPLLNGGGLGISVSAYCTGSGHSLIGEGITPDVELSLDTTGGTDNQLQAALERLQNP